MRVRQFQDSFNSFFLVSHGCIFINISWAETVHETYPRRDLTRNQGLKRQVNHFLQLVEKPVWSWYLWNAERKSQFLMRVESGKRSINRNGSSRESTLYLRTSDRHVRIPKKATDLIIKTGILGVVYCPSLFYFILFLCFFAVGICLLMIFYSRDPYDLSLLT